MFPAASTNTPRWMARDPLLSAMDGLKTVLAEDGAPRADTWASRLANRLARVQEALEEHKILAQDPDGLFAQVDGTRPTLSRQADQLRKEHEQLLQQAACLRKQARTVAEFPDLRANGREDVIGRPRGARRSPVLKTETIRQDAERLLTDLEQVVAAEGGLLLESVNTDIGTGD